jgi:hypothetical protein
MSKTIVLNTPAGSTALGAKEKKIDSVARDRHVIYPGQTVTIYSDEK